MKNLKEITLDMSEAVGTSKDCCSYQGSKLYDRELHRVGLCILHLGALYDHCPSLLKFNGIKIGSKTWTKESPKWKYKMKEIGNRVYKEYVKSGGKMEIKEWRKKRGFSKQPSHPVTYGKARLPQYLH